ncbi:hypothetical protein BDW74DRAFT_179879 [Aspergillus multicolor]|uniref:uncharacterized protein n=1 Tax=Aspergillus multicolor TaxID=41759 RepID=UPI003CCD6947
MSTTNAAGSKPSTLGATKDASAEPQGGDSPKPRDTPLSPAASDTGDTESTDETEEVPTTAQPELEVWDCVEKLLCCRGEEISRENRAIEARYSEAVKKFSEGCSDAEYGMFALEYYRGRAEEALLEVEDRIGFAREYCELVMKGLGKADDALEDMPRGPQFDGTLKMLEELLEYQQGVMVKFTDDLEYLESGIMEQFDEHCSLMNRIQELRDLRDRSLPTSD